MCEYLPVTDEFQMQWQSSRCFLYCSLRQRSPKIIPRQRHRSDPTKTYLTYKHNTLAQTHTNASMCMHLKKRNVATAYSTIHTGNVICWHDLINCFILDERVYAFQCRCVRAPERVSLVIYYVRTLFCV